MILRTSNGKIATEYYQKPTSKNRLLNYQSEHPHTQKKSNFQKNNAHVNSIHRKTSITKKYKILVILEYAIKHRNIWKRKIEKGFIGL